MFVMFVVYLPPCLCVPPMLFFLANIEKHAGAAEAAVLVRSGENTLLVSVSDSGRGFSPPGRDESGRLLTEGHYGLWGMHERAAAISGTLTVDSSVGEGAIITLQIPLEK